jgi:hypothetical protein
MNMVMTQLEMKPEAPSRSMWVPPRLRRVRPTWASVEAWAQLWVLGVVVLALVNGVPGALVKGVPEALALALALACGVVLQLPDPWALGVWSALPILAMANAQT